MKKVDIDTLLTIINRVLSDNDDNEEHRLITNIMLDEDILNVGFDSFLFIQLIVVIEEEFECEIPDEKLLISEMNTVNKIIDVLQDIYVKSLQ